MSNYLGDPESGDDSHAVFIFLLGDDDPLAVSLDLFPLQQPDAFGRRGAVQLGGQDELLALLPLLHLGEVGGDSGHDLDDLKHVLDIRKYKLERGSSPDSSKMFNWWQVNCWSK